MKAAKVALGALLTVMTAAGLKSALRKRHKGYSAKKAGKEIDRAVNSASKQIAQAVRQAGRTAGKKNGEKAGKFLDTIATRAQSGIRKNASSAKKGIRKNAKIKV